VSSGGPDDLSLAFGIGGDLKGNESEEAGPGMRMRSRLGGYNIGPRSLDK
jgi:hypothetical protein